MIIDPVFRSLATRQSDSINLRLVARSVRLSHRSQRELLLLEYLAFAYSCTIVPITYTF
jgi:hypothetical protein